MIYHSIHNYSRLYLKPLDLKQDVNFVSNTTQNFIAKVCKTSLPYNGKNAFVTVEK